MKNIKYLLQLAALVVGLCPLSAEEKSFSLAEVEMNWPGIHYQMTFIKRIPPDRLLVGVRVLATAKAPSGGTLIGFPVPIPPNADPGSVRSGVYHPRPLSLADSVMVDDITQQKYPALPPISPPGRRYIPGEILGYLKPGQNLVLTVQFTVPPPPPPLPDGQAPVKPTISFLFTKAKDYMKKIPVPPPIPASP